MIPEGQTPRTLNETLTPNWFGLLFDNYKHFHNSLESIFRVQKNDDPSHRKQSYIELLEETHNTLGLKLDHQFTQDFCYECEKLFKSTQK